jgi:rSAM/selenodomain-associated transferase 1
VSSIAIALICKTPRPGFCKTRLSPPLNAVDCAALSRCFIADLAATIRDVSRMGGVTAYAVYTPVGSEHELRALLPGGFRLQAQSDGDLGARLLSATRDLLAAGHSGAILVNADSPTLPAAVLADAVHALRDGGGAVLAPALDGGYVLIGLNAPHPHLFADIPWSTPQVCRLTLERAQEIGLPITHVPQWYDIDDEYTLRLLQAELAGERLEFAAPGLVGADAPCTRQFFASRRVTMPARPLP